MTDVSAITKAMEDALDQYEKEHAKKTPVDTKDAKKTKAVMSPFAREIPEDKKMTIAKMSQERLDEFNNLMRRLSDLALPSIAKGKILATIQRKKLYRGSYETFAKFCKSKCNMSSRRAYQLINAHHTAVYLKREHGIPIDKEGMVRGICHMQDTYLDGIAESAKKLAAEDKRVTAKHINEAKDAVEKYETLATSFNPTNESVSWAKWTWNPITGCRHGCEYCYSRTMFTRFPDRFKHDFDDPHFHKDRMAIINRVKLPEKAKKDPSYRNVFVCSMSDLFGVWVSERVSQKIVDACKAKPEWNFIFLTKNPERLLKVKGWTENTWVGTTVDLQKRVKPAMDVFAKLKAPVKFLSCEPLLEDVKFPNFKPFDWIIIGAKTQKEKQPPAGSVKRLVKQAWAEGKDVYLKPNLKCDIRDYPAALDRIEEEPADESKTSAELSE